MKEYRCPKCKKLLFKYDDAIASDIEGEFGEKFFKRPFIVTVCPKCGEKVFFEI